jgi:biotin carboxylase
MPLRLMILGGGSSQIEAFRRARREGFFTVLADHNPAAPARPLADAFASASTFDVDAVTRAARDHRVDALLAIGTDQPVLTAARVSATLGLPFPLSPEQALLLTNKAPMKRRFAAAGIPSAPWALLGPDETRWTHEGLDALTPPWVAKPVDSQGQRGIAVVHSRAELLAHRPHLLRHSREDTILVEEYYPSREVTVSGWVDAAGTPEIWTITDRVTFRDEERIGVCLAHRYPSLHARGGGGAAAAAASASASASTAASAAASTQPSTATPSASASASAPASPSMEPPAGSSGGEDVSGTVRELTGRIVAAFGLADGPIYFQMLVGAKGVLVNEIAFRLGGAYEDQSIPLVTGVDILGRQLASIRANLEKRLPATDGAAPAARPVAACFVVPLMFCRPGTIVALEGDQQMRATPGVGACRFLLPPGTTIRRMTDSTQRIAYAVLYGPDATAVNTLVDTLFDTLRVVGADGGNLLLDTRSATKLLE